MQGFIRQTTDLLGQPLFVERDQLRHVNDRFLRQAAGAARQANVARGVSQSHVRGHRRAGGRADCTFVKLIRLHDQYRSAVPRPRALRLAKRGPPNLASPHYHFSLGRDCACASARSGSMAKSFSVAPYTESSFSRTPENLSLLTYAVTAFA